MTKDLIVHFRLLKIRSFLIGLIMATFLGFVLYGSLIPSCRCLCRSFWVGRRPPPESDQPRGLGIACCMPLVGYLLGKGWDGRWMLIFGLIVTSWAFFGYSHMSLQSGTWDILFHQINQGVGMAFVFIPLTTLTMDLIPRERDRLCHQSL